MTFENGKSEESGKQRVGRETEPLRIAERNVMTRKPMRAEESAGLSGL